MKNRIQIYPGARLRRFLETRPLQPNPASQARLVRGEMDLANTITETCAINRMADRYCWLLDRAMPKLNKATWEAVLNAGSGWTEHTLDEIDSHRPVDMVRDDLGIEGDLDAAEKTTGIEFAKLAALDDAGTLAVIEVIERFWGRRREGAFDLDELIAGLV
jgi:hypothetical protein